MPTIGWDLYPGEAPAPCVWCGNDCTERADAPFSEMRRVPLHLGCGGQIVMAFARYKRGEPMDYRMMRRLTAYTLKLLPSGT